MIVMLWKELRENVKWSALALLGLLMAEFYALNQQQFFGFYEQESAPLCKSSFLMITTFGCAAVGLVLGLIQFLPEQRRDQWAALLHRPVPRATIFRGKALAGLLLYFAATIIPFAACVWYVSTPGHFAAPFTPRMIFPGVADICAGAMYYFAALFVSLQRGAWWGTRAFGVLAALSGSFIVTTNWLPFYVVIETTTIMSLALFTAAWGAMLTNGTFAGRPWLARFAALAVVFFGICAAAGIAVLIWAALQRPDYYFGKQYAIDLDGRPLIQSTGKDGSQHFVDLDGKEVDDSRLTGGQSYRNLIQLSTVCGYIGDPHQLSQTAQINYGYRSSESYCTHLYLYDQVNNESWFYLHHDRIFEGFNTVSRSFVGSIGFDGFVPGTGRATRFPKQLGSNSSQLTTIYRFGHTVYFLDVAKRAMTPIFTGERISGAAKLETSSDDPVVRGLAAVAVPEHLVVVDKTGQVTATLPFDHDMDRWGALESGLKSAQGPYYLQYQPSDWISWMERLKMPSYLEQFDAKGHLLKSYTLPPLPQTWSPGTWEQWISEGLESPAFFYGGMIYEKIGAELGSGHLAAQLDERLHQGWDKTKDTGTRLTLLSLACAIIALAWARRSAFTWEQAWKWALFVFAFNLAGLLTFRLVADWPVRIKCPACGRPRRVDTPACPHCAAAWPVPSRDGTEIADEPAAANAGVPVLS